MKRINRAIAFIKPHAVGSDGAREHIVEVFRGYGIDVASCGSTSAEDIALGGLVDRHYANNAGFGLAENAVALVLRDSAKEEFALSFGEGWDEAVAAGRVFSGEAMRLRLGGISGEELNARWASVGAHKLCAGCYVAYFAAEDSYVINGFYPSIREVFTKPGASIELMTLSFDLPWSVFRRDIIGGTNPGAADEGSIRGFFHDHAEDFGLEVDSRDNVIHASASPFEAFCESRIWLPEKGLGGDPLWRLIHRKSGLPAEKLEGLLLRYHAANPMVELGGASGPVLDLLEDLDTPRVAEMVLELLSGEGRGPEG